MLAGKENANTLVWLDLNASGNLLVVAAKEEIALTIERSLRNAAHPLRAIWVSDIKALSIVLKQEPPDLVLCDEECARATPVQVIACRDQLQPELPVIRLTRTRSIDAASAAMAAGASDLCSPNSASGLLHLELVVMREIEKHLKSRALRSARSRLEEAALRHQRIATATADAWVMVREGIVTEANPAFCSLLGRQDTAEVTGQSLVDLVVEKSRNALKQRIRRSLKGNHDDRPMLLAFDTPNGELSLHASVLPVKHESEQVFELLIAMGQLASAPEPAVSKSVPETAPIEPSPAQSVTPATPETAGAPDLLESITAPPGESKVRVAMLARLDGFDALEKRIGPFGARAIASLVSIALANGFNDSGFYDFSADEWALVTACSNLDEIIAKAESVVRQLGAQIYKTKQHESHATLSIGINLAGAARNPEEVLSELAGQVRKISASGGNRAVLIGAAAQTHRIAQDSAQRTQYIERAIEQNRLKLSFRTIASLEGESINHYDVMLRMLDDAGQEPDILDIQPGACEPRVHRSLDRWVIQRTLATISRQPTDAPVASFFVGLSEETLRDPEGFILWFQSETRESAGHRHRIVFEMPEPVLQNHVGKARNLCQGLRQLGSALSIEGFGTTDQTQRLLEAIPASFIKFDAERLVEDPSRKRWLSLVEAARQNQVVTVASQVKEARQLANLWQLGINFYVESKLS